MITDCDCCSACRTRACRVLFLSQQSRGPLQDRWPRTVLAREKDQSVLSPWFLYRSLPRCYLFIPPFHLSTESLSSVADVVETRRCRARSKAIPTPSPVSLYSCNIVYNDARVEEKKKYWVRTVTITRDWPVLKLPLTICSQQSYILTSIE